jgi:hypothetical protein
MPHTPSEFRIEARKHAHIALKVLVGIVTSEAAATNSRITAATAILDRAFGRPTLPLKAENESESIPRIVRHFVTPEEVQRLRAEGREPPRVSFHVDSDEEGEADGNATERVADEEFKSAHPVEPSQETER